MEIKSEGHPTEAFELASAHDAVIDYARRHLNVPYEEGVKVPSSVVVMVDDNEWRVWYGFRGDLMAALALDFWALWSGNGIDLALLKKMSEFRLTEDPTMDERLMAIRGIDDDPYIGHAPTVRGTAPRRLQ